MMANVILSRKYKCSDDCKQEGCPTHEAKLSFRTEVNTYIFDNGKGGVSFFEHGDLQAFIDLLKELSEYRIDAINPSH